MSGHATAGGEGGREGGLASIGPAAGGGRLAVGEWEIAWAQFAMTLEKSDFCGSEDWLDGWLMMVGG